MKKLLGVMFGVLLATATTAFAHEAADKYVKTSQEFKQLAASWASNHEMPRITDKKAASLISTLSDSKKFLVSPKYQAKDLDAVMNVCGEAHAAVMSYALFEVQEKVDAKDNQAAVSLQVGQLMEKNMLTYQDEMQPLQSFVLRCMATEIPLLTEFTQSLKPEELTDVRRAGIQKSQNGMFLVYYGFFQGIVDSRYKESYRFSLVKVLAETSSTFASTLPIPARQKIHELAVRALTQAPSKFQSYITKIVTATSDTRCEGLCKF